MAIEKLHRWVTQYWIHINRFQDVGAKGEKTQKSNGSVNDEVARRFRIEVIEDKEDLSLPNLKDATREDIKALCSRFAQWVASVGEDPEAPASPRLRDFLVIDDDSLHSLVGMADNMPPHRAARNMEEKLGWHGDGHGDIWLVDPRATTKPEEYVDWDCGWVKMDIGSIEDVWFERASRIDLPDWTLSYVMMPI